MAVMNQAPLPRSMPDSWGLVVVAAAAAAADGNQNGNSIHGRALAKRHMRKSAIAGTTVGVVLGVLLLLFCLYPFVVRVIKRRRGDADAPFDPEAAIATEKPEEPDTQIERGQQRLSSDSSFRRGGFEPSHLLEGQHTGEPPGGQIGWATPRIFSNAALPGHAVAGVPGTGAEDNLYGWAAAEGYGMGSRCHPDDGDFAPDPLEDTGSGVLKGTSADYYSASIPSEAFGMNTQPEPTVDIDSPARKSSRGSSLRQHVMSIFHHKNSRGQTIDSIPQSIKEEPTIPIIADGPRAESSTNLTPIASKIPAPNGLSDIKIPEASYHFGQFAGARSPPANPPPGTVNPMDIMPASTESEHWYRTEQELYASSYELSPGKPSKLGTTMASTLQYSLPTPGTSPQAPPIQTFLTIPAPDISVDAGEEDILAPNGRASIAPKGANGSNISEQSTPFLAHGFTDASSQNTPSTQLDTPSPESGDSSDYRLSASPQPAPQGDQSPRKGVYCCDEPGCTQVFDLSHKLKHHQRYHSKDHKCTYPGCGKGFGTKTHLQRHINDRHERKKKFHCSIPGCDYSRAGGKAFPRKDNWKRHMMKIHNIDQQQLPEPVEADMDMTGM